MYKDGYVDYRSLLWCPKACAKSSHTCLCRLGTSAVLGLCLEELAFKYPATKFVKIVSTECIPSYPDQNLPTVLLYHNTQCVRTIAGLSAFGGLRTTPESAFLPFHGVLRHALRVVLLLLTTWFVM